MEIEYFETVPSTQLYAIDALKNGHKSAPFLVWTRHQTHGIGSRGNSWIGHEGNLFLTFALPKEQLVEDLPLTACAIYFSMLFKEALEDKSVWVKWPNDLYIESAKVGGVVTSIVGSTLVTGIGINTHTAPDFATALTMTQSHEELLERFIALLLSGRPWKRILNNFQIEFDKSRAFFANIDDKKVSMREATVCEDGALMINGQRIFSLR
ncbi:MAG: hypothetical protein KU37_11310 [Sulfuricurvum sp. PC08-66]|nr:MAG: hypothetical protein KU37_11310 [Sulfuricurvum sp. PC08-66]